MKKLGLILLLPLLSGCSTTLKQQWYDFNAYYNTFYNAKQYFQAGLEADHRDHPEINPNELIRIHPPPTGRGQAEFAIAIEKSADILRRHPRSRYIHDAVELIGRSFFYRGEFFAAQEKFRELYRNSPDPEQQALAVIWEGRTYLELGFLSEGIRFLEEHLQRAEAVPFTGTDVGMTALQGWTPVRLAEARAVLAQLYTFRGDHYQAGLQLLFALDDLHETDLAPRVYFHYGQLMDRMGNLDQAASAFAAILPLRTPLHLDYHARIQEADILRQREDYDAALSRLYAMEREDNFLRWRQEIRYEIARVDVSRGRVASAEERLTAILRDDRPRPTPPIRARTYYELAEINRYHYRDHLTAAAYYDSAASLRVEPDQLPPNWDASSLADVWREYAQVRMEIDRMDSLLTLSRLPRDQFERRVREIERQHLAAFERQEQATRGWQTDLEELEDPAYIMTTDEERRDFLNSDQPERRLRSSQQFRQIWGSRPLRDNWRRGSVPAGLQPLVSGPDVQGAETSGTVGTTPEGSSAVLDLSDVPFDPADQVIMASQMVAYRYRLGNIYLIHLKMPEEAEAQFRQVREEGSEGEYWNLAMYALADIALERGDRAGAERRARELIEQEPDSRQAELIAGRLGWSVAGRPGEAASSEEAIVLDVEAEPKEESGDPAETPDEEPEPSTSEAVSLVEPSDSAFPVDRTVSERIIELESALEGENPEWVAAKLFEDASKAIQVARTDSSYEWRQHIWQQLEALSREDESLQLLLKGEGDRLEQEGRSLPDELLEPDGEYLGEDRIREVYPYRGQEWDLARGLLVAIREHYGNSLASKRAGLLLEELERYPHLHAFVAEPLLPAFPGVDPGEDPENESESKESGFNPE